MTGFIDYGFDVRYIIFSCEYLKLVAAAEYGIAVRDYLDAAAGHGYYQRAERQTEVRHIAAVHARSDVDFCIP